MREMSIVDIFKLLIKRWWIIIGLSAICGLAMFLFTSLTYVQEYSATGTLIAGSGILTSQQLEGGGNKVTASDLTASVNIIPTYLEILQSDSLATAVATKVACDNPNYKDVTYIDVSKTVYFSNKQDTTIIVISSKSTDKDFVKAVVAAYLELSPAFISNHLRIDDAAMELDSAKVYALSDGALSDGLKVALIVAVLVCAAVILIAILDQKVRGEEDFVANYEVPVLGVIPVFDIPSKKGVLGFEQKK